MAQYPNLLRRFIHPVLLGRYSAAIFSAIAHPKGHKTRQASSNPPKRSNCCAAGNPAIDASTAPAPKISTGMTSGNTSKDSKTPLLREPNVRAAPSAPIKLIIAVPRAIATINTPYPSGPRLSMTPISGAATSKGTPVVIQCAAILARAVIHSGWGAITSRSSVPSPVVLEQPVERKHRR